MKKTMISSAVLAAVAFAAPAAAQEANFSGFTVTALGGYDAVRVKDTTTDASDTKSGFAYGGAVGYDYNAGSVVVGAEAEIMGSTAKYREDLGGGITGTVKPGRDIYAGIRVGTPVTSNVLVYAKAGYTNARIKATVTDGVNYVSESENFDGYRLGAGAEVAFDKLFGRLEYRFSDYGHQNGSDFSMTRHQVLVGVGYRF